jgi:hypothetical protein
VAAVNGGGEEKAARKKGLFSFVTDNDSSRGAIQLPNTPAQDGNLGQMISVRPSVSSFLHILIAGFITSESSHCFRKGSRNSGRRLCIMVCPSIWEDYYMLIYTHCWELMNSVGCHGSLSLPFVMKVMVCHFVGDSHEVMTALIVVLPLIVVVEISLQLHQSLYNEAL